MRRLWRGLEVVAWTAFFAAAVLILALRFWLLPDIERFRPDIVAAVSRTVGQPVVIGAIEAGWDGLRPRLVLTDVRILDAQGQEALALPAVENVLSWRSLLAARLKLHLLAIDAPRLALRRDASGALHAAGMRLTAGKDRAQDSRFLAWLLEQEEIQVRDAEIEWRDELRGAPPLALSAVSLRIRNAGRRHAVGLSAKTPAALGTGLEARAELRRARGSAGDSTRPDDWSARLFVELGYTDLAAWRAWVDYPLDVQRGQGALRLWATLDQGALSDATADLDLQGFAARLAPELPALELAALGGRVEAVFRAGGYDIAGRRVSLVPASAPAMEPTDFRATWRPAGQRAEHGSLTAKLLDLGPLAGIAAALPLPEEARAALAELAPRGQLLDARLDWRGSVGAPQALTLETRFTGLSMNAHGQIPGFTGLSGSLEGTGERLGVTLASRNATLELPAVLPQPRVPLEHLDGHLVLERRGERGFAVSVGSLAFGNEHLEGSASGSYAFPGEGRGSIDLTAQVARGDGAHAARYLPRGELMGPRARAYLAEAIRQGRASDVKMRLRGDLADFPFADPAKGEFRISVEVRDGVFAIGGGWPEVTDIDARLLFERDRMQIDGRSARILGNRLSGVTLEIPAFLVPEVHLLAHGKAQGETAEFLKFVAATPMREHLGSHLGAMRAGAGAGSLDLRLDLPLEGPEEPRMEGEFRFAASSLAVSAELPPIERASGRIGFSESAVEVREADGLLFDGPLSVRGGTRRGGLELVAKGEASVASLQRLIEHPLARSLSGSTSYAASIAVREGRSRISIESSLRGVASTLPPPFAKRPAQALPLRVDLASAEGGRDRVSIALGQLLRAEALRAPESGAMTVQRASLWLSPERGKSARVPERPGFLVYGSLDALELDAWRPLLEPRSAAAAQPAGEARPTVLDLRIGTLSAYGRRVHDLDLRAGIEAGGWSATVKAREVAGELSYRHENAGRLVARLAHLQFPQTQPGERAAGVSAATERELPALDVIAERFLYDERVLGRLEIAAAREGADWRIDKLVLLNPESTISGKGRLSTGHAPRRAGGSASRTSLDLELATTDAGKLLERFGQAGLVLGGEARMQADVSWEGEPQSIDYATLSGNVQLQAGNGQFLEIEPGIGKLISLMSLQALPRRLTLDFRDVFSKGFRFDRIAASAAVSDGVLALKDFDMEGPAAKVEMGGQVDLARETQDLTVRVLPALGDTASTVIGILNPLLLFPAAIAQRILKDPLGHIFAFNYAITGSWADPKVERTGVNAEPLDGTKQP